MYGPPPRRVEDYTDAALAMALVNLLWIFGVVWAVWGLWPVLMLSWAINLWISRLALRRDQP